MDLLYKVDKLWYNIRRKPYCVSFCGFTAPVRCTGCDIDGFAKNANANSICMQASIFASWYKKNSKLFFRNAGYNKEQKSLKSLFLIAKLY